LSRKNPGPGHLATVQGNPPPETGANQQSGGR
jgi:hypothetical protein